MSAAQEGATMLPGFRAMARYNRWMNERIYGHCENLSDAERKADRGAFFRSIHGTLNHLLLGDRLWLGRFLAREFRVTTLLMQSGVDPGVTDLMWLPGMGEAA